MMTRHSKPNPGAAGNRRRVTLAVAVMLLIVAPVRGQQGEREVELQAYRIPGWSVTPSIAFGATYDTNVALSSPRASVGETQGDGMLNVVPAGQLQFLGKHTEFSAAYGGFFRRYIEVEGLEEFAQRGAVSFKRTMSRRLTLTARNSFADSPTTDEVELNGVPFRRAGSRTNTLAISTDYRLSKLTTWYARYDSTWVDFEQPDPTLTGGWIHALRNEISHTLNKRIAIGGEYSYRTASMNAGERDFGFQDVGGVVRLTLGPQTSASAAAGFGALNDRNLNVTRTGPYLRLGITHALEHATIGAGFAKHYVPTFGFGGATSSQELNGFIFMPLGGTRFYTQGSATWRHSSPFEATVLELDTIWVRSVVGFAATRWARLEGHYTFTSQDSIVTGGEVARHRAGVQFVISQPMRIR